MQKIVLIIFIFLFTETHAELVKGKTIGYKAMGTDAVVEFADSARVYPFEPVFGKWRLVMWVGFVSTEHLQDSTVNKGVLLQDGYDYTEKTKTLQAFKASFVEDVYQGNNPGKRKIVLYLYIPDEAIIEATRVEARFENVLKAKKKNQWGLFEQYKEELGFVSVELVPPYKLHFVYDGRSPESRNDFRLLILTDTARQIVAFANDGYRKIDAASKSKIPLDRDFIMYFTIKVGEEERKRIRQAFIEAYQYRD